MENKDTRTNARLLISELLVDEKITKFMNQLVKEKKGVFKHCVNVAYLTAEVCEQIYPQEDNRDIVIGALLHDIGKLHIPNDILYKKGRLTEEEYECVKQHPLIGYDMVKNDNTFSEITKEIILSHHEKTSGVGYPYHKKSEEIPQPVQIVTVCDMYDALTEKRTYGKENNAYNALKIISQEKIDDIMYLLLAGCPDK